MAAPEIDGFVEGFIEQDAQLRMTRWSAESERIFGWTAAEAVGRPSHSIVPERNRVRHDRTVEAYLASAQRRIQRLEMTALHKDGHEFRAEFYSAIEDRDGALFITTVVRAIRPDARVEAAFRQRDRYQSVLNQIDDGCSVVDLRGQYLYVNDAFCRMFHTTKEVTLGHGFRELQDPQRQRELYEIFNRVYRTGAPMKAYEFKLGDAYIEQSISLERNSKGEPIGFVSIYRDCTARKLTEAERVRATESAEAANRAKSEFLANMSHEIRTPMNGIIGMAALALDTDLTPLQSDCLNTIRGQADSLLTIVNDILDFSKIESRHVELERVVFPIEAIVHELVKPLALKAGERRIAFSSSVASDVPPRLVGDPVRVAQVVTNLLANAIKFTERGSVSLRVGVDARDDQRATVHIAVTDTGIGIPADKQSAIFEPFRQADGSMTRRYGGTGLGLAIAATLVELMGGRLSVESEVGAGSTFHFIAPFPIAAMPAVAGRRMGGAPLAPPARAFRVLVAEDNIVNQRVAEGLLKRRGHEVTVVANGREALDALQKRSFDLVLMDLQMPDMDGFEATAAIRARERQTGGHVRIVAMTAHAMTGDRDRCLAAGMDGYLSKPIEQRSLYDAVEQ